MSDEEAIPSCPNGGDANSTIEQTNRQIRFNVTELLSKPLAEEDWESFLVSADQLEPSNSDWVQILHLPGIHVVGKIPEGGFYLVAVNTSYVPWLLDHRFQLEPTSGENDVSQPSEGEVRVHGIVEATRKAASRFLKNAVKGVWTPVGFQHRGLDQYYRQNTVHPQLQIPIEWAILIRDVVQSDDEVLDRLIQRCVLTCLILLGDFDSAPAFELIERDRDAWIQRFRELGRQKSTWPTGEDSGRELMAAEMHEVSLLRGLLESAGGTKDTMQRRFDQRLSANASFAILGYLLDVYGPEAFGCGFDAQPLVDKVAQFTVFRGVDVAALAQEIPKYIPVGIPAVVRDVVPRGLAYNMGLEILRNVGFKMHDTYRQIPSLRKPENGMLVLLCYCSSMSPVDQALCEWAASTDGLDGYQQTVAGMLEAQTPEQAILSLSALICHHRLVPDAAVSNLISSSYLCDFAGILDGQMLNNWPAVLEQMAFSVSRVAGRGCPFPFQSFLDIAVGTQPPLQTLDVFLDQYWSCKLSRRLTHKEAWREAISGFEMMSPQLNL